MAGRYQLARRFKYHVADGTGNKSTTSATLAAVDAVNLPFKYVYAGVGDVIKFTMNGACASTATYLVFDVEVDRHASANTYIAASNDWGLTAVQGSGAVFPLLVFGVFVATEAGEHGFRPAWRLHTASGTGFLYNGASGGDDVRINFTVENVGPADGT